MLVGVVMVAALVGASQGGAAPAKSKATPAATASARSPDDVSKQVQVIFENRCSGCHGKDLDKADVEGDFQGIENVDELLNNPKYIQRFNPSQSLLYKHLDGTQKPQMPKGKTPLTPEQLALVRSWIGEAPVGTTPVSGKDATVERPLIDDEAVLKAIHGDLAAAKLADRSSYRYITLANLWNERLPSAASVAEKNKFQSETDQLIETTKLGFFKMLNSLSWSPELCMPQAIDPSGLILRIDLRKILCADRRSCWSNTQWDQLCARYPYGRTVEAKEEDQVIEWLGTPLPFVRADWFVFVTSRPPLYHDLLGLPGSDGKPGADFALEQILGVDVRKNIVEGMHIARAGIPDGQSGVSNHNRIIERHELQNGYYWKSYDFIDSVGPSNINEHPFGPKAILPPNQLKFAFEHAGGEIIFSLPNGLQGYLLVKSDGTRIDDGPKEIVFDIDNSAEVKGQITNGISCIACHSGGINLKLDQIRDVALKAVPRGLRDELELLFPLNNEMDTKQKADKKQFLDAIKKIGIGSDCDKAECEVTRKVAKRFDQKVNFQRAAAEFGVKQDDFRLNLGGRLTSLRNQLEAGGVSRQEFINKFREIVKDNQSEFGEMMSSCGANAQAALNQGSAIGKVASDEALEREMVQIEFDNALVRSGESFSRGDYAGAERIATQAKMSLQRNKALLSPADFDARMSSVEEQLERINLAKWANLEAAKAIKAEDANKSPVTQKRQDSEQRATLSWATVLASQPDPTVVTDAAARGRMTATRLPWKIRDNSTGIVMLLVPPGEFMMGSPQNEENRQSNESQHRVTISKAFYLSQTEIPQEVWQKIMSADPSTFKGSMNPVEMISWDDCQRFGEATGLRLPSEAEWEYACRAGTTTPFSFGATITPQQVNYNGDYPYGSAAKGLNRKKTVVCGSLPANQWGFQEMHGNVLEWCQDGYSETASTTQAAIVGVGARVLRGGGWSRYASGCRASSRTNTAPNRQYNAVLGCRFARTAD